MCESVSVCVCGGGEQVVITGNHYKRCLWCSHNVNYNFTILSKKTSYQSRLRRNKINQLKIFN